MKNKIVISFIFIIIAISIIILLYNNYKTVEHYISLDYKTRLGPIIFLQENNNSEIVQNCLGEESKYKCIGTFPHNFPDTEGLKYMKEVKKIYIPKGEEGNQGRDGITPPKSTFYEREAYVNTIYGSGNSIKINDYENINLNNNILIETDEPSALSMFNINKSTINNINTPLLL
tara:strand:+ start:3929 stop:4450 length:522 start_codon:yes stop_codon:yes gene_type:complete